MTDFMPAYLLRGYLLYIMQMMGTTKFLYKNCPHSQKCKIQIFKRSLPSNSPEIASRI